VQPDAPLHADMFPIPEFKNDDACTSQQQQVWPEPVVSSRQPLTLQERLVSSSIKAPDGPSSFPPLRATGLLRHWGGSHRVFRRFRLPGPIFGHILVTSGLRDTRGGNSSRIDAYSVLYRRNTMPQIHLTTCLWSWSKLSHALRSNNGRQVQSSNQRRGRKDGPKAHGHCLC
jgi:hypothetical protein